MPIRPIRPRSDRGKLLDLLAKQDEFNEAPTPEELNLKYLYEQSQITKDARLQESLGFIVMPQAGDRSAFPITVYRHREYVNSLSKKSMANIERTKQELQACFSSEVKTPLHIRLTQLKQETARQAVLSTRLVKRAGASVKPERSFRRVR
jgi:hypothetical protein